MGSSYQRGLEEGMKTGFSAVQLFKEEIIVESSSGKSSQAIVFFGREKNLNIRVVLKQYIGPKKKSIMTEIKIFTKLENIKKENCGDDL